MCLTALGVYLVVGVDLIVLGMDLVVDEDDLAVGVEFVVAVPLVVSGTRGSIVRDLEFLTTHCSSSLLGEASDRILSFSNSALTIFLVAILIISLAYSSIFVACSLEVFVDVSNSFFRVAVEFIADNRT